MMEVDGARVGQDRPRVVGYLAVILATACWASSGIFVSFIMDGSDVSALALTFWRDLSAFVLLVGGLRLLRPDWLRVERRDLKWLAGLGAIGVGALHVLWTLNVTLNGVAVATVQLATMPTIVALAARLLWGESLTYSKGLAIGLALLGTVLVSGPGVLNGVRLTGPALLVGLATPLAYAAYSLFGKPLAERYAPLTILTYGFGFAVMMLLPFQFFTPQPWSVPAVSGLWFALLTTLATVAPFTAYTFGLSRLPASVAGILTVAEIPFAALFAFLALGERLLAGQWLGAILVVCGVLLLSWGERRRQRAHGGSGG